MQRMAAWTVLVIIVLVAAGCGDGGDEAPTADEETTEATADEATAEDVSTEPPDEGACELVTAEAVAEAFGEPAELTDARPYVCQILVGDLDLTVQRMDGLDPEGMSLTACAPGTRVEVEAGDAAHVCMTEALPAPFGAVSRDGIGVWIGTPYDTDEAVVDRIAALLPLITVPAS